LRERRRQNSRVRGKDCKSKVIQEGEIQESRDLRLEKHKLGTYSVHQI
jgi:hypothetical protein